METLKIIVADDQPVFRIGLELIIKKINESFNVFHAANGCEILEIIKCHQVDIVFIDPCIPGMNCIETTCRVKRSNPDVKIIALSSLSEKYDVLRMFKAGANGYLLKNASLEKIETAFKTIIKGGNYFTDEMRCFFSGKLSEKCKQKFDNLLREELTEREKEILIFVCQQLSTREISEKTGLSEKTIEIHRGHIMNKTHSKNMVGLALYAVEKGFFTNSAIVS